MHYARFYISITIRLLVVIGLSAGATYLFFAHKAYLLSGLSVVFIILATVSLLNYFNGINRWISFFLLGIENEDTSLKVPSHTGNKAIDNVYKGVARLNELFKQKKIDISVQEQYFRTVINQSATGLISVNDHGRVVNINPAAVKLTNLHEQHHINSASTIDKALPEFVMRLNKNQSQNSAIFENRYGQKLLFKLSEIKMQEMNYRLIAVSDITKELDNSEVDAWIKLARTLSHEIMNNIVPITTLSQVIKNYFLMEERIIEKMELEQKTIENAVKGLNVIEERSIGLMSFVDNYRKFTKLPIPEYSNVDISELINNCLIAASAFNGFNLLKLEKVIPQNFFYKTDEKLLSQVILNLLKNANEALQENVTENPSITIRLLDEMKQLKIDISNNGPKILPEIKEQIFVPFFTTKENGSGIGLSLSKQIIMQMGGDLICKSEQDGQTTFSIILA